MCLGIPGKVIDIYEAGGLKMGKVDSIVHVGFGISQLDEAEARRTLELLAEMEMLADELPELNLTR
jgi:hydrogenase expression/formation protein HypC